MENVNFMQSFNSELNINNENINSEGLLINYDGENMDIAGYQNNDNFYAQLSNEDIMRINNYKESNQLFKTFLPFMLIYKMNNKIM